MRIFKNLLFIICITTTAYVISSCERDDICSEGTPTTPFLIIKFFDFQTGSEIKAPTELQVKAVGVDSVFVLGTVRDSILIPLRTNASITEYELSINSDTTNDTIPINTDTVSFQYSAEQEYVSSACGFKVKYEGLTQTLVNEQGEGNWIKNISIDRLNVTDETTAHVFIFH